MTKADLVFSIYKVTFLLALGILLLDSIRYFGFVQNHFLLPSYIFALGMIVLHLVLRLFTQHHLPTSFSQATLLVVSPLITLFAFLLFFLKNLGIDLPIIFSLTMVLITEY